MEPKWDQKLPKSSPDGAQGRQNGAKMVPRWGQDGEKIRKKRQRNKKGGGADCRPPILAENVANMVPTWVPKWSQDGQKIDPKIDNFLDASWDRFFIGI